MITEVLINLGMSAEEADVYQSLLNEGVQSASQLDKTTKVKRTNIYNITQGLIKKGLVSQQKDGRTTIFVPLSPDKLLTLAQQEKQAVSQTEQTLEAILPILKSKYNLIQNKPIVTYYEGVEGVKKVYSDLLKVRLPISAIVQTSAVEPEIYNWLTTDFVKQRIEFQIPVRAIVGLGAKTETYVAKNEAELRESKIVPSETYAIDQDIDIYGDKVAIINNKRGAPLIGIVIDDKNTAKTFRTWFDLTWSKL